MIDKKQFLEHTELFEKLINDNLNLSINNLNRYLFTKNDIPKIYTTVLDDDEEKYSYFLSPIVEPLKNSVYIDKPYKELKKIENNEYLGYYILGDEKFRFIYTFEKDNRYDEKINKIYKAFLLSNLEWKTIDKRYINKMYTIKLKKIIDEIENTNDAIIEYNLDENFIFKKNIYWNIKSQKCISKKNLTVLSDISCMYIIEKEKDEIYLVDSDSKIIDDVLSYEKFIEIYSNNKNLYTFDILCVKPFDKRFISHYSNNIVPEIKVFSLENIKNIFFKSYGIKVSNPFYSNENLRHIKIPDYDPQIIKFKTAYIYFKLEEYKTYEDVFHIVNFLNINLESFEVRVYE